MMLMLGGNKRNVLSGEYMNKFKVGDKVLYCGKKYKIDHIRDDGTAKIHSISGKTNEICYRADISKFKLENI